MSGSSFDTLEAAEALTRAGVAERQARAIVAAMRKAVGDSVATKGDVAELRTELKGDNAELKAELKGDNAELKAELKGDIAAVKAELWAVKWVLGFVLMIVLAMAARLFGVV